MTRTVGKVIGRTIPKAVSVLIVEDERLVARDLEQTLSDMGYIVTASVASGKDALRAVESRVPDVALMDIHIKGEMDGIATAAILLKEHDVPVVYVTAYADETTIARASRTLPYGYVVKPFSREDIRSAVEITTHRHALDRELAERERWFSTTLRSIGDAIVASDPDGIVHFMNPAAEALTGWSEADAVGRRVEDVVRFFSENGEPVENLATRALSEQAAQAEPRVTRLVVRGSNRSFPVHDSAAPILQDGPLLGAVLLFRDVTEQRQLDDQRAVTERLSSLGVLASKVADEIHDPLTYSLANISFALGQIRSLSESTSDPGLRNRLGEIVRPLLVAYEGGERIARAVGDLRLFYRAEQQALRRVDLRGCLDWALERTVSEVRRSAHLGVEIGRMPPVIGNEARLSQVFVNLLRAAAQAVHGRREENQIRVVGRTDPNGMAVVEVWGTSGGIPDGLEGKLLDALSPSRDILRWLEGNLVVESTVGSGTFLRVTLPAAEDVRWDSSVSSFLPPTRFRLLVVGDDIAQGRTIHRLLAGHDVTVVQCAGDALTLIEREPPFELLLCDLVMPDMSGADFHRQLVSSHPELSGRIGFMTDRSPSPRIAEFLDATNPPCIEKPFSSESLVRFIHECIDDEPMDGPSEPNAISSGARSSRDR